jgi:hypothetical protein
VLSSDDWTLKINVDIDSQELIFETVLAPNKWLAIGLAYDLLEADIMQWVAGPTSLETGIGPVNLQ